ncbi:helix-turn-helix domain-containing protein [uncultured Maricaulis sp.]|mgnify:CR=1 FL=1|uniref:winged helix-turn-helix transcriptional regulator n=1 Tax=uncultured Maricaulis sp. TaxID=174710 RepID=UPI0030DBC09F|tara:strand:+ start:20125 stop:20520 length:396 start_codon:yes stop_codon:yes gene_type:complete
MKQIISRSGCPIASTLDLVGDRWTLVILRDLINGKRRFTDFLTSPERITTNVLTDRLGQMEQAGLITRTAYQTRPPRFEYRLTAKGEGLLPVIQEMCRWANINMPSTWEAPESFMALKPGAIPAAPPPKRS